MKRLIGVVVGALAVAAMASPVDAAQPQRQVFQFTTDPYTIAECDGYDIIEQLDVYSVVVSYQDRDGNWVRDVIHSSTTGVDWRSDTGAQVATFSDVGGTFTAKADNTFTWTGIHVGYTTTSGATFRFIGRVVVAEVEPGDFEMTFRAGSFDEIDPCSW